MDVLPIREPQNMVKTYSFRTVKPHFSHRTLNLPAERFLFVVVYCFAD